MTSPRLVPAMGDEEATPMPAALFPYGSKKTHCNRGHPLEGENLRLDGEGHRHCVECGRGASREYARRNRDRLRAQEAAYRTEHAVYIARQQQRRRAAGNGAAAFLAGETKRSGDECGAA